MASAEIVKVSQQACSPKGISLVMVGMVVVLSALIVGVTP